ncbi:MTH1187 family thiamine-binding protein [Natranaerobius thermophilus]|uniref:Thiamine-binding protein domain-containing protein n=1 Tax=Natranaerobius thermophilus (strain ATCC BAA-1301 / DSM 18059 / JW/NM-WN-LF) TaxID=457570 RepID=B2A497_NATTJ|nr:MTH1187 family thiamine-binding protein [Natranaerobius thermophilus]ACB83751.1 protein of unknown function DUF77 [Natranaerobius thermophilus JW/NM-WN-LF]
MAIVEVSVAPLGTGSPSISPYVADCHQILESQSKVNYKLTPMGTILEGDLNDCLDIVKQMHQVPFDSEAQRVVTNIKIDDRRDKTASMNQKVSSVTSKMSQTE